MYTLDKSKVVSAVGQAAMSDITNLTADRIEALAGGHGMVNIAIYSVANVITSEILRGESINVKFANERRQPVDDIMRKAIHAAELSGTDPANAALITASIMYLAGSAAQVGIPTGNRKLGASARMIAGVPRSGVAAIPTSKMNSKISGFPAVMALYNAMLNGTLSPVQGYDNPGIGGCLYGHSALGEDIIWPGIAERGTKIAVKAMLDSMSGLGISPNRFQAAVLGAAAVLELIHPDAEVPEGQGTYGRTSSVYLVGKYAVEAAGLPEKLHMRLTHEEYDTAHVIGDAGLILKDIGAPSVVGMMSFVEIFGCFEERLCGASGGPFNSALGHMTCYAVAGMKSMIANGGDAKATGKAVVEDRIAGSMNPESALFSINIMTRKAAEVHNGPITRMLINATAPATAKAITDRAMATYDGLTAGRTLAEIVREMDEERVATVEKYAGIWWKRFTGHDVTIKYLALEKAARRTSKLCQKYFSFDAMVDVEVTADGKTAVLRHFADDVIPKVCMGEYKDIAWAVPYAAPSTSELCLSGCNILNVVIPAATAAVMGTHSAADAAAEAEPAAKITAGIPGCKAAATKVAELAVEIAEFSDYTY